MRRYTGSSRHWQIWWEQMHDALPATDKGRGRQADPFLDMCKAFVEAARPRFQVKGADLGALQLSGIVSVVLAEMRRGKG